MNTSLSFRRETIQPSSSASEALNRQTATAQNAQGRSREQVVPTLTTTIFTI